MLRTSKSRNEWQDDPNYVIAINKFKGKAKSLESFKYFNLDEKIK